MVGLVFLWGGGAKCGIFCPQFQSEFSRHKLLVYITNMLCCLSPYTNSLLFIANSSFAVLCVCILISVLVLKFVIAHPSSHV